MSEQLSSPSHDPSRSPLLRSAAMTGSSIAGRDAAPWVTDFLNAACYRRRAEVPDVDDLRLAFAILTTYWYRTAGGRRLRLADLPAFHRAFGAERLCPDGSARGTLDHQDLLLGAAKLLGDWFPGASADPRRRGWGVVFPTAQEKDAYDHGRRLALARLGALTPSPRRPSSRSGTPTRRWRCRPSKASSAC